MADDKGWVGGLPSLGLDSNNRPHISYYDIGEFDLKYAYYDGTSWKTTTLDRVDSGSSLALDGYDHPHISYGRCCSELEYAYYDGTTWQKETVDSIEGLIGNTSLALDFTGRPHISYDIRIGTGAASGGYHYLLRYAYYDGSTWQIQELIRGEHVSLALDRNGRPHASYYDLRDHELQYAYYNGTTWITETVDSMSTDTPYSSLALAPKGQPYISYYDFEGRLKYAYFDGMAWQSKVVDGEVKGWGPSVSLALDAASHPHIAYYDSIQQDLRYIYYDGTTWHAEIVDGAENVGQDSSLVLDSAGLPHIAYFGDGKLKYAHLLVAGQLPGTGGAPAIPWLIAGAGTLIGLGLVLRYWARKRVSQA